MAVNHHLETSIRRRCVRLDWRKTALSVVFLIATVGATTTTVPPHNAAAATNTGVAVQTCDKVAELDALRDYDLVGRLPTQGPICGANSCCGAGAELKIRQNVRKSVDAFYRQSARQVSQILEVRSRRLEELFREMMAKSKKELHAMFERTYGMIYLQNSVVFTDFFAELEKYYNHGGISLTETIDRFFSILYQRMFKVINAQYDFDDDYLSCVAKDIADLMPFGDIPRKLATLLRRAFVATRTFHRALSKGAQVAERMLKWNVSERECAHQVAKMQVCDSCLGLGGPGPCFTYCTDTLKSCFGPVGELNEKWDVFIDGLDKISDKLLGPFNIEMVVEPINVKISEAIMNFQESGADVSRKVFQMCGQPKLKGDRRKRRRRAAKRVGTDAGGSEEEQQQRSKEVKFQPLRFDGNNNNNSKGKNRKKHKKTNDYEIYSPMEKRIIEVKQKMKETRGFWSHLPYQYCNNISTAAPSETNCWNGRSIQEYSSTIAETNQVANNNANKNKNQLILEQIYVLNVLIAKLESAYLGQDDELTDDDDDEGFVQSGSGSGDDGGDIDPDQDLIVETSSSTTPPTIFVVLNNATTPKTSEDEDVSRTSSTTIPSSSVSSEDSNEVDVDIGNEYDNEIPQVVKAASGAQMTKAIAYYVLPVVMVWFGGAVVEIL